MLWLYHPNLWILHWFCLVLWLSSITHSQVLNVDQSNISLWSFSYLFFEDHDVVLPILSIDSVSIWFNGCCCSLWISHVSKSWSVSISWLVPPHIKYHTSVLPDNLHVDHKIVLKVEENSHVLLFLPTVPCFNFIGMFWAVFSWAPSICAMWISHWLCLVMVLWLTTDGVATKPRASCGRAHKVELLGTRWYHG
jgi:hypothetical protein